MAGRFGRAVDSPRAALSDCTDLAQEDLRHVQRVSASCGRQAAAFYCERAKLAAQGPRMPAEELCGPAGTFSAVQMRMESARQAALAFFLLAHDRFAQARRLISRVLHPEQGLFLCHLDTKVARPEDLQDFRRWAARSFYKGSERVQIFSAFPVHRGGRSMLEVQLQAMRMLLSSSVPWEYYVNLSDTHYPAEAMSVIGSYLWLHDGTNYARITSTKYYDPTLQGGKGASYGGPRQEDLYVACDRTLAFECEGHLFSVAPGVKYPPLLTGIKAASGPEWLVLSKDFVEYVIQGLNSSLVRDIYDDLTALSIPEETFFQTLLLSSRFCHTVLRHEFLYLDLYDAPWRRSEKSDFPFQSPRPLNGSHLRDIAMEEPWFVRKVDSSLAPSRALRGALEAGIARRERPRWLEVAAPTAPLLAALGGTLEARGLQRLVSPSGRGHWAPQRLRLRLRTEPTSASGRPSRVGGGLELAERVARPKRHRGWELPPVVAMRVGCGWDEAAFDFRGEVSVIGCQSNVSLVAYLRNVGFEGEVAIHWLREGRLLRQSGGHVPKGFTMFVDHLSPSIASPGRWSVSLTDVDSGNRIGERSFLLFGVDAKDTWPSLQDYEEFFDFSPAFSGRMRGEKEAPLL
ncbi:unnamed protein product [Effrenium voratum]|nr:unnamed protein product [Effrenium voratum]